MTSGFRIERADREAFDIIVALEQVIFPEDPWTPGMIADELDSPFSAYFLAIFEPDGGDDGFPLEVVGYAGVKVVGDGADVMTIGVLPGGRGRGCGSQLMETLVDHAELQGATSMFLEVRASNDSAIRLYERCGFARIGVRRGYFRHPVEDGVEMARSLSPSAR
ncbi:ribosomal protein S18-alanine N-acetyltransferase [Schaalia sp. ZJ1691]|uniref:ribosomal protein S18-alanine N-acetyltransferase n=1 Tax=Schaalia sp. ZJ1691 TaxID=2709404 RepID=UPI001F155E2C|nr:ribosomal protein S18-alanine N-acetyltransferase [Schaalia sp. ZJ1691]